MNKWILLLTLIASKFVFAMECNDPNQTIYYKNSLLNRKCNWFDQVKAFQNANQSASIVFIGDSLIFAGNWKELLNNDNIANLGISGDTTALILKRINSIYSYNPSIAYIMVGINDFYLQASVEETFLNYLNLINSLNEHNIRVNVISTLHCNSKINFPVCAQANPKIYLLNKKLEELSSITFLDMNKYLSESGELKRIYTNDGIHLNEQAYLIMSEVINKSLHYF